MMDLIRGSNHKPVRLQLKRDLVRDIKRGHCWVYRDALRELPVTPSGIPAVLYDNRGGREIGCGYYDPQGVGPGFDYGRCFLFTRHVGASE